MNNFKIRSSCYLLAWTSLMLFAQCLAYAQGAASTIVGNVADPSGAMVTAATITIENADTGATRQLQTNEKGEFSAPTLATGQYVVTAAAKGFKTEKRLQIRLEYQQVQRVDFILALGDISESTTVIANGTTLQTDDPSTSTVLDERQVRDLPLNGRNFVQLAQLVPGTTTGSPGNGNTSYTGQGYTVSVYGQRDYNNQYTLDGLDMTEARNPSPMFQPSVDAIEEFDVKSGLYSAAYGWKAGAHIDIAIKSGTNHFHGNAYEFLRNDIADARNYFSNTVDALKRNQFGATFGGPVMKNTLFFFGAYDQTRQNDGVTQAGTVPSPQQLSGDFSSSTTPIIDPTTGQPFPGNIIPASRIDSNATILAAFYPAPNVNGAANFVRSGPAYDNDIQWFARADYNIRDSDHLFAHFATSHRTFGNPPLIANFTTTNPIIATNTALQEVHIFTPKLLNSFLFGFSYYHRETADATVYTDIAKQLTIPGVAENPLIEGIPSIDMLGYASIGQGSFSPLVFHNQNLQLHDNVALQKGTHSINIGVEVTKFRFEQTFIVYPRGYFNFTGFASGNPIADFLLGLPLQTQVANALTPGHLFNTPNAYYVQDDWKVTPNLTVNAGLRYELNPPVHDARGNARNLNLQTGELFPSTNVPMPLWHLDKTNIAPRVGAAYRPFSDARTVIRGGFGLFYSTPELNLVTDSNLNPPFGVTNSFASIAGRQLTFENPYPVSTQLPQGAPIIYADAPDLKNARTALWNIDVQRSLKSLLVDIGYTGSKSTNLAIDLMPNQPTPGPGDPQTRRLFPQYGQVDYFAPKGYSNYNGLAVKVEQRFTGGLFLLGSYTYSKAIDLNDAPIFGEGYTGGEQNKDDLSAERATAGFSRKHVLSFSYGYELPFGHNRHFASHINRLGEFVIGGWQTNGIVSWSTGPQFSVFVGGDPAGIDGNGTLRPDRIANGNLPMSQRNLLHWFDTKAFVAPPAYTFGSSARDILVGPGTINMDASLFKHWNVERFNVELRGEAFNIANHPNFGIPGQTLGTPTYGVITSAASPRLLQIALKASF